MPYFVNRSNEKEKEMNRIRKPHPLRCFMKSDLTHTLKGTIGGLIIMTIAVINLVLFFGFDTKDTMEDEAEYISKISNTAINLIGIFALLFGIAELNRLKVKDEKINNSDLDIFLLKFTSFFSLLYMVFTIITGSFNKGLFISYVTHFLKNYF